MPDSRNGCGYLGKGIIVILAILGIICSGLTSTGCKFLYFKNNSDEVGDDLEAPFLGATEAYVGVYEYEVLKVDFEDSIDVGCQSYGKRFESEYEVILTAQILGLCAPLFAVLGLITMLFDTCIGTFYACFLSSTLFFLAASGCQSGTFALYADPSFCIEGPHDCGIGITAYYSIAAIVFFWFACVLQCCFPRPDPFCDYKRDSEERDRRENERREPRSPTRREKNVYNNDEYEESPPPKRKSPKKKKSKRKLSKRDLSDDSDKINDDDFDDVPQAAGEEGVDRVEFKEKSFPDGSRQVDEITYYEDGTKSVDTKHYGPGE